jgi:hypothetical protein
MSRGRVKMVADKGHAVLNALMTSPCDGKQPRPIHVYSEMIDAMPIFVTSFSGSGCGFAFHWYHLGIEGF